TMKGTIRMNTYNEIGIQRARHAARWRGLWLLALLILALSGAAGKARAQAYFASVPNATGYPGQTVALQARLLNPTVFGTVVPVRGAPVAFTVAGQAAGYATTDTNGYATLNYTVPYAIGLGSKPVTVSW